MPKKLTQDEFVRRATIAHNGKYDYSCCKYINISTNKIFKLPLNIAFDIEQHIVNKLNFKKHIPDRKFEGWSECFDILEKEQILNIIEDML